MQPSPRLYRIKGRFPFPVMGRPAHEVADLNYSPNTFAKHAEVCLHLMREYPGAKCWPYLSPPEAV